MTSQIQTQIMTLSSLDSELIFDSTHLIMNYLKLNSFNANCFSETTIQILEEIKNLKNKNISPQELQTHTAFASNYFTLLAKQEKAIDVIAQIISSFPNSDFGLFLAVILRKHLIN